MDPEQMTVSHHKLTEEMNQKKNKGVKLITPSEGIEIKTICI